ncbi:hypothetical protein SAMN02745247_01112 [Butyrivibrio hungatei DSM 14810]|uniref:Uncharacterized protein n=1 Tax=Butyrivibrio hungatei DSM 14810 TaxID=1121132 RepID=A0A1M7S618_9FIRM|nr:hypothetical protein [Butyrivibrio hungatei]SHN53908.1 hypothetical protein SAMN02745247_01112 [Butyrivibrio hungatei DSM 14810]
MSNLGGYQVLTTVAKKVHGPGKLLALLLGGGLVLGVGATKGTEAIINKIKSETDKKQKASEAAVVYKVDKEGRSNEGLLFKPNDEFKVLERDGDAGLIELIGNNNNPYFVSLKFLSSISNYAEKI